MIGGDDLIGEAVVSLRKMCKRAYKGTAGTQRDKFWMKLYSYAWFVSFGIAFAVYLGLSLPARRAATSSAPS